MIIIPDANTLIYFAKADLLDILDKYEVWVGEKVYEETVKSGKAEGKADAYILENHIKKEFKQKSLKNPEKFQKEKRYFRGPGETDVFLLAKSEDCLAITSDTVARRKLKSRGINVIRSDMLLFRNFNEGEFNMEKLNKKLIKLRNVGGTTDERINFLMNKAEKFEKGGGNYE